MAFKLTKAEDQRRMDYVTSLNELKSKLEDAIGEFNAKREELKAPVEAAFNAYKEALAEAKGFAEDIASAAEGQIDDKSERWQESERGEAARSWQQEWEGAELDEPDDIDFGDDLDTPDLDHADTLENLPIEADNG